MTNVLNKINFFLPDHVSDCFERTTAQVENLQYALLDSGGAATADLQNNVVDKLELEQAALQPATI
jgi:hypothetical protein